jgi:hypothetical protein
LSHRFLFNIYIDPAAVILCSGSRYGASFTTLRQVLSEAEEFIPTRVLLTLLQCDRVFGKDSQDNSLVKTLQQAINLMKAGKNAGAIGNLDSFISEVKDLLSSGVLSPSQAASLISAAESVIAQLS